MQSSITHTAGGVGFNGSEAVSVYQCIVLASALELYAKTGLRVNRFHTPTAMIKTAKMWTGQKFKARQYTEAAAALRALAAETRSRIPEIEI